MKIYVGLTDKSWFDFLADLQPDEVNFWQPGGNIAFKVLSPGEPFLFKLHSPNDYIVGGGFFVSHSFLPISIAWETFHQKNGSASYDELRTKIMNYRRKNARFEPDPMIGCIILTAPFFFKPDDWISLPDWSKSIVQGKSYRLEEPTGKTIWSQVQDRLYTKEIFSTGTIDKSTFIKEIQGGYGTVQNVNPRLGQGAFRVLVTDAYNRRCAVTGERTLPVLEAAHIKPFSQSGPHNIDNGVLLRSDLHKLFDIGYLTINQDYQVEVSKRIKEEYENGRDYYALQGKKLINLPNINNLQPSKQYIEWHNENVFVA